MTAPYKLGILLISCASLAAAQYVVSAQAGTIHFTLGDVYLDGQLLQKGRLVFPLLKDRQVLQTGHGRVEVLLAPGVFLRLGQQSALRMLDNRLENTLLVVQKGRALVEVVELVKDGRIQIQCGDSRSEFKKTGLYRVDADAEDLRVFAGEAEVVAGDQKVSAGRGLRVSLGGTLAVAVFSRKSFDALYKWAARRSFELFLENLPSSRTSGKKPTNWVYTSLGWFWNPDYGTQFAARGSMLDYLSAERNPRSN